MEQGPSTSVDQSHAGLRARAKPTIDRGLGTVAHRYSPHDVDDMPVEPWVKAKTMLSREILATGDSGAEHRLSSRFATPSGAGFVNVDFEPALGKFVSSGQSGDSTADHDYGCHFIAPKISSQALKSNALMSRFEPILQQKACKE